MTRHDRIVLALVFAALVVGFTALIAIPFLNHVELQRNCDTSRHFYAAFQRVLGAVERPPTLAGHQLTAPQQSALHSYADSLRAALGKAPVCAG